MTTTPTHTLQTAIQTYNKMACETLEPIAPLTIKDIEHAYKDLRQQSLELTFRKLLCTPLTKKLLQLRREEDGATEDVHLTKNPHFSPEEFVTYCRKRLHEVFPDAYNTVHSEPRRTGFFWAKETWVVANVQVRNFV
jgi:hypothetical protein